MRLVPVMPQRTARQPHTLGSTDQSSSLQPCIYMFDDMHGCPTSAGPNRCLTVRKESSFMTIDPLFIVVAITIVLFIKA